MARKRPDPANHKQLPPFVIEEAAVAGWIAVTCGYKDCGETMYVKRGRWLHGRARKYIGRSCTYCYRTGRVIS